MDYIHEINRIKNCFATANKEEYYNPMWSALDFTELVNSAAFHEELSEELLNHEFKKLLGPFDFDENGELDLYVGPRRIDEMEGATTVTFPVKTMSMQRADHYYFAANNYSNDSKAIVDFLYKPFFYELSVTVPSGSLRQYPSRGWKKITVRREDSREIMNYEGSIRYGSLSYGASPFEHLYVKIPWDRLVSKDKLAGFDTIVFDYCNNNIKADVDSDVQEWFDECFDNVSESTLNVMRVGQANCILGNNKINGKAVKFAFDLGFPTKFSMHDGKNGPIIDDYNKLGVFDKKDIENISQLDLVIISHWHQDHFLAAFTVGRDVFYGKNAAKWIAPVYIAVDYEESGNRLVAYLIKNKKIRFVSPKYTGYQNGNYYLGRVYVRYGDLNYDEVILQANRTLLPGDSPVTDWPKKYGKCIGPDIEYLIFPHHGGGMADEANALKRLRDIYGKNGITAIISVGHNNYGHPDDQTLKLLKSNVGFKNVYRTDVDDVHNLIIRDL